MKSKYKNLAERFGDGVMLLVGDYVTFTDGSGFLVGDATPYHEQAKTMEVLVGIGMELYVGNHCPQ